MRDQEIVLSLEEELWQAVMQKDGATIDRLLAEDYFEITLEGRRIEKAEIVTTSPQVDDIREYHIHCPKILPLETTVILLTYRLTIRGTTNGASIEPKDRWATSIWCCRGEEWTCRFFQQSRFQQS